MIDITGQKFNKLTVLRRQDNPKYKHASWLCRCDCGNLTTVVGNNIRNGGTKSCGCSKGEYISNALSGLPSQFPSEYSTYHSMLDRCYNPNIANYEHYGKKGIIVCFQWLESFENFLKDMGPRPLNLTLDRKDFNGNYEPSNCRWATVTEQNRNKSTNVTLTYCGLTLLAVDWAVAFNISVRQLKDYLKYSRDFEDCLHRYNLQNSANQVLKNHSSFNVQPEGRLVEFKRFSN